MKSIDTINDTTRLYTPAPWYSLEYQDGIHPDSLSPYGSTWVDTVHARHRTGERNYEMTDHLGNVMVTITDQLRMRTYDTIAGYPPGSNNPVLATSYQPGYSGTCDYYPFGMPMPNSYTGVGDEYVSSYIAELDDFPVHRWFPIHDIGLNSGCATCNIDTMATAGLSFSSSDVSVIDTYIAPAPYTPLPDAISHGNWMIRYRIGGLHLGRINRVRVSVTGMSTPVLPLSWFRFRLYHADYSAAATSPALLYSAPGVVTMSLTPTAAADTALVLAVGWEISSTLGAPFPYSLTIDSVLIDYDTVILIDNVMAIVSADGNYNYGYNGQMKNNKWAGFGNHNTAQFWEYDTRVARRGNQDPVPSSSVSNYAAFVNSPIWFNDVKGDTPTKVPTLTPASQIDYSKKEDAEKMKRDIEYIKYGKGGNMFTRWWQTFTRDLNAPSNNDGRETAEVLEGVAEVIPVIGPAGRTLSEGKAAVKTAAAVTGKGFESLGELGLKDGMKITANDALRCGERFLGKGYKEVVPGSGRFVSQDGTRVFRMGVSDITGAHGGGPHVNFETLIPNPAKSGKMMVDQNVHIYIRE